MSVDSLFPIRYSIIVEEDSDGKTRNPYTTNIRMTTIPFSFCNENFMLTLEERTQKVTTKSFTIVRTAAIRIPIFMIPIVDEGDIDFDELTEVVKLMMQAADDEYRRRLTQPHLNSPAVNNSMPFTLNRSTSTSGLEYAGRQVETEYLNSRRFPRMTFDESSV